MVKLILMFLCFSCAGLVLAQNNLKWVVKSTFELDSNDVWANDVLGNTYTAKKDLIYKYDTAGVLQFSQSQKSFGRITSMHPINTMKMVVFSEEQQVFCLLDNTLTQAQKCYELSDHDIGNASVLAISGQPDKIWIYDQLNSSLFLLSLSRKEQGQEIENLRGLLNNFHLTYMIEQNNFLYLVDEEMGVFTLDMYGSLVDRVKQNGIKALHLDDRQLYTLVEGALKVKNMDTRIESEIALPIKGVIDFRKEGNFIYLRTRNQLVKYEVLLLD
jgi:hypothetical protein